MKRCNKEHRKSTSLTHLSSIKENYKDQKLYRCQCCKHTQYIDYNRENRLRRQKSLKTKIQKINETKETINLQKQQKQSPILQKHSEKCLQAQFNLIQQNINELSIIQSQGGIEFKQLQRSPQQRKQRQVSFTSTYYPIYKISVTLNQIIYEVHFTSQKQIKKAINGIKQILHQQKQSNYFSQHII